MNSILDIISPVRLRMGHHKETASTGQGCIMDVASYLAGDAVVTDSPPCVDRGFQFGFRIVNDALPYVKRQELLPYVLRMIGTATEDKEVLATRMDQFKQLQVQMERGFDEARQNLGYDWAPSSYARYLRMKRPELTGTLAPDFFPARVSAQLAYGLMWLNYTQIGAYSIGQDAVAGSAIKYHDDILDAAVATLIAMLPPEPIEATAEIVARGTHLADAVLSRILAKETHAISCSL